MGDITTAFPEIKMIRGEQYEHLSNLDEVKKMPENIATTKINSNINRKAE